MRTSDIVSDGGHPRAGRRADAPGHERDGRGAGAQVPVLGRDEGLRRPAHQSREGLHRQSWCYPSMRVFALSRLGAHL